MKVSRAMLAAEKKARAKSVFRWGVFGFLFAIVAIPAAYIRSPRASTSLMVEHDDDATMEHFSSQYSYVLKQRQIKAAWVGFGVSVLVSIFLLEINAGAGQSGEAHCIQEEAVVTETQFGLSD